MKKVVGISDMQISSNDNDTLITYSLGSCIAVIIWDPVVKVGGLLHFMLPESKLDAVRAASNPYMFADSGIPAMFKGAYAHGAKKNRLVVKAVGGSQLLDPSGLFNIGQRNYHVMKRIFQKNKISIAKEDIGGSVNRTVSLDVGTGHTILKVSGRGKFEI